MAKYSDLLPAVIFSLENRLAQDKEMQRKAWSADDQRSRAESIRCERDARMKRYEAEGDTQIEVEIPAFKFTMSLGNIVALDIKDNPGSIDVEYLTNHVILAQLFEKMPEQMADIMTFKDHKDLLEKMVIRYGRDPHAGQYVPTQLYSQDLMEKILSEMEDIEIRLCGKDRHIVKEWRQRMHDRLEYFRQYQAKAI